MRDGLRATPHRGLTVGLLLTVTVVAFEALAVSTVMPLVERELGDLELYGWVFSAFFLGSLVGTVVVGGLLDRGSIVMPLLGGLALFAVGLAIDGLAPSMPVLVGGRLLQGLGGGAVAPTAYVAISRSFPESLRPRMLALLSTAWVLPGVIGPAIAGVVGQAISWRAVFLGLLPLVAIAATLTALAMARVPALALSVPALALAEPATLAEPTTLADPTPPASAVRRLPAAILVAVGVGLAMAGLTLGASWPAIGLLIVGIALALPALLRLTPPGTLRLAAGLPAAIGLRGVLTFSFFMADAYLPLLLVGWRGATAADAGLALTASTLAWTVGAWVQARTIGAWGAARLVGLGFVVVAAGVATTLIVLSPAIPWALAIATWGVAGLGMGLAYSSLSLAVLHDAAPEAVGAATSALQLTDLLGTALGTGLGGAIVAAGERAGLDAWVALAIAFALGGAAALAGAVASVRLPGPIAAVAGGAILAGPVDATRA